jgi:hypothetical protein
MSIPTAQRYPPGPQWQCLQFERRGPDVQVKRNNANKHTNNIGHVVTVLLDYAFAAAGFAAALVCFKSTGKGRSDEVAGEFGSVGACRWGDTGCCGKGIDEFENEEFRECSSKIGNPIGS